MFLEILNKLFCFYSFQYFDRESFKIALQTWSRAKSIVRGQTIKIGFRSVQWFIFFKSRNYSLNYQNYKRTGATKIVRADFIRLHFLFIYYTIMKPDIFAIYESIVICFYQTLDLVRIEPQCGLRNLSKIYNLDRER